MTSHSLEIKLDWKRTSRIGLAEAVFCLQKSSEQIQLILEEASKNIAPLLLTRLSEEKLLALKSEIRLELDYDAVSQTAFFQKTLASSDQKIQEVAVVAAGTSDAGVAQEAMRTLEFNDFGAKTIFDVGVAGIWRLMDRVEEIGKHSVVIAVAGMDAALPTVLGGLVPGAIIALPTSTGYGASRNGETALSACLSSCAPGVVVCNIDNGYGAACAAIRILLSSRKNSTEDGFGQKGQGMDLPE